MKLEDFKASLDEHSPPEVTPLLQALWYDAKGNWDKAHQIAQKEGGSNGAWVHAYLHREEGDLGNASFWYSQAGRSRPSQSLEEEWNEITEALLNQ